MKIFSFALILSAVCSLGCTKKTNEEFQTLTVGMNPSYPPFESINEKGIIEGFDVDISHAIAKLLGKKLVIRELEFDALILGLKYGKIDLIISGMSITTERQKEIIQIPYQGEAIRSYVLLSKGMLPAINNDAELGKIKGIISVQHGTWMEKFLSKNSQLMLHTFEGTPQVLIDVLYDKSAAAFLEPAAAKAMLIKRPELKFLEVPLREEDWVLGNGIGIKKEATVLRCV